MGREGDGKSSRGCIIIILSEEILTVSEEIQTWSEAIQRILQVISSGARSFTLRRETIFFGSIILFHKIFIQYFIRNQIWHLKIIQMCEM